VKRLLRRLDITGMVTQAQPAPAGAAPATTPGPAQRAFGTDPATSALDVNCKMHELDNVYAAGSSFFVSSTAVNPTLTITASALRVAGHIAERLGATAGEQAQPTLAGVTSHA